MTVVNRYAIFVDAGYFSAAAAKLIAGTPRRSMVEFDFPGLRKELEALGGRLSNPARLLRVYWYDAAKDAQPTSWHNKLGDLPDMKVRLGRLRANPPQQKGVDTLLVLDLVRLARQQAVSDVVLIGGDEDLREGVAYIQECGTRVHLVTADRSPFSRTLMQEADTVTSIGVSFFGKFAAKRAVP